MTDRAAARKAPPAPPSRLGLPHVIAPHEGDDTPASWLQRLAGSVHGLAVELHDKALRILRDGDLTAVGQRKAVAKEAARSVNRFAARIAEESRRIDAERKTLNAAVAAKISGDRLSEAKQAEWRAVLRSMSRDERIATLRAAAAGELDAADEVIATLLGASSPLLCGFPAGDPAVDMILDDHRQRHAAAELNQIAELDATEVLAAQAAQWLDQYALELLDGDISLLRDAQAVDRGHRPLSELTVAEKVARIEAGKERGGDLREALYTPAEGEAAAGTAGMPLTDAEVARFAGAPLADKIAAAEAHPADPAAAVRAALSWKE